MKDIRSLNKYIDSSYKQEESLILRYYKGISFDSLKKDDFEAISLREGAKIHSLINYKGVSIYVVDESTMMTGGTYKALEACFTMALCKKLGYDKVTFSSGANNGSSLTIYGKEAGIETYFFCPKTTSWELDGNLFEPDTAHLISVDRQEKEVKKAALLFAEMTGIPHIPKEEWRFLATGLRAFFVFEYSYANRIRFDWISQAVCAGYGPIGFYNAAQRLIREGIINKRNVPKFLGIQQEPLSPMVKAWQNKHDRILAEDIVPVSGELLTPTLYNTNPSTSYPVLYKHISDFGGRLISLNKQEYAKYLPLLLKGLADNDIRITTKHVNGKDEVIEKAGLMGLCGMLKAIDEGIVKKDEAVLSFLTGGAGSYSEKQAVPEYEIKREGDLKTEIEKYLNTL